MGDELGPEAGVGRFSRFGSSRGLVNGVKLCRTRYWKGCIFSRPRQRFDISDSMFDKGHNVSPLPFPPSGYCSLFIPMGFYTGTRPHRTAVKTMARPSGRTTTVIACPTLLSAPPPQKRYRYSYIRNYTPVVAGCLIIVGVRRGLRGTMR